MEIAVVTYWYNDASLAPFFLAHYNYVDKIYIFLDIDTDDDTREICKQYDNVEIEEVDYPKRWHPIPVTAMMTKFIAGLKSDWVYFVDVDEFIFPRDGQEARVVLARQSANLLYAEMWQTWRHKTETDLDPSKPSIYQRRHGILLYKRSAYLFTKPCIIKPEVRIRWHGGHHSYRGNSRIIVSEEKFIGAHWKNADIEVAIRKKIEWHYHILALGGHSKAFDIDSTAVAMRKIAENHLNDPQMF